MKANGKYQGVDFIIDDLWMFFVPSLEKRYESYDAMTTAITAAAKANENNKREKLALPAITSDGHEVTLTGIHAGHGGVTSSPRLDSMYGKIFPRVPWIAEAIAKQKQLTEQARQLDMAIRRFSIDSLRYTNLTPELHAAAIKSLRDAFEEKRTAAEKTALENEMAKPVDGKIKIK